MMKEIISCTDYVKIKKEELARKIKVPSNPTLVTVQIGDDPSSNSYICGKQKDCQEVGIDFIHYKFPADISHDIAKRFIIALNEDRKCDGIILQMPVPIQIDLKDIQNTISPFKDVDGFNPARIFKPCTPLGIINYLKYNNYVFKGKNACVIGRSEYVGKPLAQMLLDLDCTVTVCHSKSNIDSVLPYQDIVFTCIDKIEYFDKECFYPHQSIIDIGLGKGKDGKLYGNLTQEAYQMQLSHTDELEKIVISGTGGVGLLTRLELLNNTYDAMIKRKRR